MRLLARGVCNPALGRFSAFGPKPINTAVERQEASVPIARRANAFARRSSGSIARSAKGASQAPSASRRSIPSHCEGRKKGHRWTRHRNATGGGAWLFAVIPGRASARTRNPDAHWKHFLCVWIPDNRASRGFRNDNQEATAGFRLRASRGWSLLRGRARARDGAAIRR
jgi:hypothetical protein